MLFLSPARTPSKGVDTLGPCRHVLRLAFCILLALFIAAKSSHAVTCPVQPVHDISPAEQAFLEHNYDQAAKLYTDQLTQKPNDPELVAALSQVLLRQQKVKDAQDLVQKALVAKPDDPILLTALGQVQYRAGTPWLAAGSAHKAMQLNPCLPELRLLEAQLLRINSLYASAATEVAMAHKLDPHDPMIRLQWINSLPPQDRIQELEAYLNSKTGDDEQDLASLRRYLDHLRKQTEEPHKPCRLVSNTQTTDIPFISLMRDATHIRGFGLDVKLNDHSARLQIDTGAGGIVVSRTVAERAGLQRFAEGKASGIGNAGEKSAYSAYADDIRIGALEFKDCQVEVLDARNVVDNDGLIGMDVFSNFLVTLDYPLRKLTLGPLPKRPDEAAPATPALQTGESSESAGTASSSPSASTDSAKAAPPHGPRDRYIAPEMKDWEKVYRIGHQLLMPTLLNDKVVKLFILDTGAFSTTIDPDVAREITKVHSNDNIRVKGISGSVDKVYTADDIDFKLGGVEQKNPDVVAFASPAMNRNLGMDVAGLIGITTLGQLTLQIDYRDGLVKFNYDPHRGYKYPGMH
jgi:predicted aspartyl protease